MGRKANDCVTTQNASRGVGWQIFLPQVNAIGLQGQGDIDAIIDNDFHTEITCDLHS
jgi:hypothetical protein